MIVFRFKGPPELKSAAGAGVLQRLRQRHTILGLLFPVSTGCAALIIFDKYECFSSCEFSVY